MRFTSALVGAGRPYTATEWDPIRKKYTPGASSVRSDFDSKGYEARVTANLTRNWRLVANYSYTDSGRVEMAPEAVAFYGLKRADAVLLTQPVSQDASGSYIINGSAVESDGAIAKWIELGGKAPNANPSTLTTSTGVTIAREIFDLVEAFNDEREQQIKRWGVRPHKVSLFTAYDFRAGRLEGFTDRRRLSLAQRECHRLELAGRGNRRQADRGGGPDVRLQREIPPAAGPPAVSGERIESTSASDDIIPSRIASSATAPGRLHVLPGGRGIAYSALRSGAAAGVPVHDDVFVLKTASRTGSWSAGRFGERSWVNSRYSRGRATLSISRT